MFDMECSHENSCYISSPSCMYFVSLTVQKSKDPAAETAKKKAELEKRLQVGQTGANNFRKGLCCSTKASVVPAFSLVHFLFVLQLLRMLVAN